MSKHQPEERRTKRRAPTGAGVPTNVHDAPTAPAKLAALGSDPPAPPGKVARGTRDLEKLETQPQPHETDEVETDTIVVDPEDSHVDGDVLEALDLDGDDDSIDAHMLELGRRRFGISYFRPGQALAIR